MSSGFTIEVWVNPNDASTQTFVEWNNGIGGGPGTHQNLGVHLWQSFTPGSLFSNIVDNTGVPHHINSPDGIMIPGQFQHVAVTYDKTTGDATLYRNGQVVASLNLGIFTPQTSYDLYLGNRPVSPFADETFYSGLIDETAIYDRALTATEIQSIFLADLNGKLVSCGLNVITSSMDLGAPIIGSPGSDTFQFENTGTVTLQVSADIGAGLGDTGGIHILPIDTDVDGTQMIAGTPTFITNLGPINPITSTLTVQTDNLQNFPAAGIQSGTLTLTGGICS